MLNYAQTLRQLNVPIAFHILFSEDFELVFAIIVVADLYAPRTTSFVHMLVVVKVMKFSDFPFEVRKDGVFPRFLHVGRKSNTQFRQQLMQECKTVKK
ncbi:hypothetical protein CCAND38_150014 [Capnocytophaga canis]|uniref:Uncharacterized protein n=1 Tax=Capnocytophaga canis TaxID=1848903 RepID=A0A0B7I1F8_9FLAO|nr:hypothetical protein CCAND38_150014 [Capnocytophaga canis]